MNHRASRNIESQPPLLLDCCTRYICDNFSEIFDLEKAQRSTQEDSDLILPGVVCEYLIDNYQNDGGIVDDQFLSIFCQVLKTSLRRITLFKSNISVDGLRNLLKHKLEELHISHTTSLPTEIFPIINELGGNLTSLTLGPGLRLFPEALIRYEIYLKKGYVLKIPNLRSLTLHSISFEQSLFHHFLKDLINLNHLDLSGCQNVGDLSNLTKMKNLTSLILFDVQNIVKAALPSLCQLQSLKLLDVSQGSEFYGTYENENYLLHSLVRSLPNLQYLDISGTNLAGTGAIEADLYRNLGSVKCDIPGLVSRIENPLDFLGLYLTSNGAANRKFIPAAQIAGDMDCIQLATAGERYLHRAVYLQRIINDIFHCLRYELDLKLQRDRLLHILLESIALHSHNKHIQTSSSAAIFYIVRNHRDDLDLALRRRIIASLLFTMEKHDNDETIARNSCLTLCQLPLPHDIMFLYRRLVKVLLHIVMELNQATFVQRLAIHLLNSLACQVNNQQKVALGDLGVIDKMLDIIERRIVSNSFDDVLEVAWSAMWNVTDETAINCERFLNANGMHSFEQCVQKFGDKSELMRNMMGLLGNVAEVSQLRWKLMPYVETFYKLLQSSQDGIEISYNAAGVLSHMASDGIDAWNNSTVSRDRALSQVVTAIDEWSLNSDRNINYRSFQPILQLAQVTHTPECQHWAVWALANLTTVYPSKYCCILHSENGIDILKWIIQLDSSFEKTKQLARITLENCNNLMMMTDE